MRCRAVQRLLSARLDDGALELPSAAVDHARSCAACTRFEAAAARVRAVLRDETPAGDPLLRIRAAARAPAGPVPRDGDLAVLPPRRPRAVLPAAVAASVALVLAGGGVWLAASRDDRSPAPDPAAPAEFPVVPPGTSALLVWTAGGLPAGFEDALGGIDAIESSTVVDGDQLWWERNSGAIPLDTLAVDPDTYARFVPPRTATAVRELSAGTLILGRTSAALRGKAAGDTLTIAGRSRRVVAVLDDELIGAAEIVVARGTLAEVVTPRYALVAYVGARADVERDLRGLLGGATAVRFRAPGETPVLRHGDAVLPQAWIKRDFGEFRAVADAGSLTLDDAFVRDQIATYTLPVIGEVRCHRALQAPLTAALERLPAVTSSALAGTIARCFDPRPGEPGLGPSRHSWGIALDLDVDAPVKGGRPVAPEGLVEAFATAGFTWGGDWLVPDAGRFEWIGHPGDADLGNS
jgi:hypothetical protein